MLLQLLTELRNKSNVLFLCSDEAATFHWNALVNKYNLDAGVKKIHRVTIEIVMQSSKVHVCCSMAESQVVVGPYFC